MRSASRFLILVLVASVSAYGAYIAASRHAHRSAAAAPTTPIRHIVVIMQENPSGSVWGCDAKPNALVPLVGPNGTDRPGVFPCFDYKTMPDLLDAKGITWRYYAPGQLDDGDYVISAYQAIRHICFSADWHEGCQLA